MNSKLILSNHVNTERAEHPVADSELPKAGGPDSVPGQGTSFHTRQLRVHMLQLKIQRAETDPV